MNLICNKEESDARSNYWRHCRFCLRMEQYQNEGLSFISEGLAFFTDDTVMTCAVAEAIMNGGQKDDFIDAMKKYGRLYPNADYGARFNAWLNSDNREPYNSFGNGSAMRVSPCAWVMDCGFYERTGMWSSSRELASLSAEVTHNHPEGIKRCYGYS